VDFVTGERKGAVLVSQPVHQHGYETAVAAQNAGLLRYFVTGIYYTKRGLTSPGILAKLPSQLEERVERELLRRSHSQLDPDAVYTIPRYHILATALGRMGHHAPLLSRLELDIWAHDRFDEAVGRLLVRFPGLRIVHAFEGSGLATFRSAKRLGITTVLDVSSTYEYLRALGDLGSRDNPARARAERELADIIFAPSDYAIQCLVEHGVTRERISKIPYGVDHIRFSPAPEHRTSNGDFRALYVGAINRPKGVRYLLEAWRSLALRNAELVLVGQPDSAGRKILREFEGHYRWIGSVPKYAVHEWFQKSDALILPSLAEGSALVTYEALASGLPVVTTPNSGSVVRDGTDGFVVAPRDVRALGERIRFLYENPGARREMGVRGRELVASSYTWEHYRARIVSAYDSILSHSAQLEAQRDRVDGAVIEARSRDTRLAVRGYLPHATDWSTQGE
jgi:glycosyltransferase involved in cell wall biosynthesis